MPVTNGQLRGKSGDVSDIVSYPVRAEVEYRLKQGKRVVEVGRTQMVSLSSSEVILNTTRQLAPRMDVELITTWPGLHGMLGRLVLRVHGRTGAGRGSRTKVQVDGYDFETRPEPNRARPKPVKAAGDAHLSHAAPVAS